jgi:uncharacterized protein involved in response to NO
MSLRANPYKLFFPLGMLCGWLGVSHWFLYGFGYIPAYSGLGHALVLTEAMFGAFAFGFLMTAVPRRTQTPAATWGEIVLGIAAIATCAIAANRNKIVLAEYAYVAQMALLLVFAMRRTENPKAGRRPPNAFVMIPIACAAGIIGGVLIVRMSNGQGSLQSYLIGRELVQQAVYLCILVAVGSLLLPLIYGNPPPPDADDTRHSRLARFGFAALALGIIGTLVAVPYSPRLAAAARAVLVAAALIATGVARWPSKPGLHRWVAALAVWLAPIGLAGAAVYPRHSVAALHVMFVGSLSLVAFAASSHVIMGHGGLDKLMSGRPVRVALFALLIIAAMCIRASAHLWLESYYELLGVASILWIAGSLAWLALLVSGYRNESS